MSARILLLAAIANLCLAGCATRPVTPPLPYAHAGAGYRWGTLHALPDNAPETMLILTFSGGGTRAAALSYGVLEELRRTPVHTADGTHSALSEIDLITGTSGGSFTALAYALYGDKLFEVYEHAFLKRDVQGALVGRLVNPLSWSRVMSPGFGRSELAQEYYDEILFHGATFGDLLAAPRPKAIVGATDATTGTRVDFSQDLFDVICADLSAFPLARAAAASSAVPVLLSPVTLDNRGGTCGYRPPAWTRDAWKKTDRLALESRAELRYWETHLLQDGRERPYLHLVDGGLSDNLALYGVVQGLEEFAANPAARAEIGINTLRRVVIVVVNARSAPRFDYDQRPSGPSSMALLAQSISVPMDRYSTESIAALRDQIRRWEQQQRLEAQALRLAEGTAPAQPLPPVQFSIIDISFDAVEDPKLRASLQNLPTTFSLSASEVNQLRATGAKLLRESPAFRSFVEAVSKPQ
jgi:NTE family protein